jgi:hypothetical protein
MCEDEIQVDFNNNLLPVIFHQMDAKYQLADGFAHSTQFN